MLKLFRKILKTEKKLPELTLDDSKLEQTIAESNHTSISGDRAITEGVTQDKLGFAVLAKKISQSILQQTTKDGLTIGIEGEWGCGKSGLLNLISKELQAAEKKPEIIRFEPWLIGSRDALLAALFSQLIEKIEIIRAESEPKSAKQINRKKKAQELKDMLEDYADPLSELAKIVPGGEAVGASIKSLLKSPKDLHKQKTNIDERLRALSRPVVIMIDELDRLSPGEITEMVRLVRAVGNFPNIYYLLAYDREIVAHALKEELQVDDGDDYLKKIIQISFSVPRPESFTLRMWFKTEIMNIFGAHITERRQSGLRDIDEKLAEVTDIYGGKYLNTPRDVNRALDALRLYATPIIDKIFLPDMVWLQLIRLNDPKLYAWTEHYLTEIRVISKGEGRVSLGEATQQLLKLKELTSRGNDEEKQNEDLEHLSQILPGIIHTRNAWAIYQDVEKEVERYISHDRLGSPDHYRWYFAFQLSSGDIDDSEILTFLEKLKETPPDPEGIFTKWCEILLPNSSVSRAERVMDKLLNWRNEKLPDNAIPGIIECLGISMDSLASAHKPFYANTYSAWTTAKRLLKKILPRMSPAQKEHVIVQLFRDGNSIGWLSDIIRDEIFDHGDFGNRAKPENERLLSKGLYKISLETLIRRYRNTPHNVILSTPGLADVVYTWIQGGSEIEAKNWISELIKSDENFIQFLTKMQGTVVSSNRGAYLSLQKDNIKNLMDVDVALARLQKIKEQTSSELSNKAEQLLISYDNDI